MQRCVVFVVLALFIAVQAAYDPTPYCQEHVLGSLFGDGVTRDSQQNGAGWDPTSTFFKFRAPAAAVRERMANCARVLIAAGKVGPNAKVTVVDVLVTLTDFSPNGVGNPFYHDRQPPIVQSGTVQSKRAFLMSVIEGEGSVYGKLIDNSKTVNGQVNNEFREHVYVMQDVAIAVGLATAYTAGPDCSEPLTRAQLASRSTASVCIDESDFAVIKYFPFASCARVPGGECNVPPPSTVPPTLKPTMAPTVKASVPPTQKPTATPTRQPSVKPSSPPTVKASAPPTQQPSAKPTSVPTMQPTPSPTAKPTLPPNDPHTYVGYSPSQDHTIPYWDTVTSRFGDAARIFFTDTDGVPSSLSVRNVETLLAQGRHIIMSMKFTGSGVPPQSDLTRLHAYLALIQAGGYADQVFFVPHHEPYPDVTGSVFVNQIYLPVAAICRAYNVRVGPILHAYPVLRGSTTIGDYMPSNLSTWDFLGIDVYPDADPTGTKANPFITSTGAVINPLSSISVFTSYAKSRGKPFLVAEFGIKALDQLLPQAPGWVEAFKTVGPSCLALTYWNGAEMGLDENNGRLVPAWQAIYDAKHQ